MSKGKFIERLSDDLTRTNATALFEHLEIIHRGEYLFDIGDIRQQFDQTTLDEIRKVHPVEFADLDDWQVLKKLGRMTLIIQSDEEPYLIGRF
jgi:hypothetical protein